MTMVTGQFSVNFNALSNINPYTNASLSYGTAEQHLIFSNAIKPTGFTNRTTQYYNGDMASSGIVKSKIEIGANPGASDDIQIALVRSSDGAGYILQINGASLNLYQTDDWLLASGSSLVGTTVTAPVAGDRVELWKDLSTHELSVYINNSIVSALTITNSTIATALRPGFGFYPNNGNSASVWSFAADGLASGGIAKKSSTYNFSSSSSISARG